VTIVGLLASMASAGVVVDHQSIIDYAGPHTTGEVEKLGHLKEGDKEGAWPAVSPTFTSPTTKPTPLPIGRPKADAITSPTNTIAATAPATAAATPAATATAAGKKIRPCFIGTVEGDKVAVTKAACHEEHSIRCCYSPTHCVSEFEKAGTEGVCFPDTAYESEAQEFCEKMGAAVCTPGEFAWCRDDRCGSAQKSAWVSDSRPEAVKIHTHPGMWPTSSSGSASTIPASTGASTATTTASANTTSAPTSSTEAASPSDAPTAAVSDLNTEAATAVAGSDYPTEAVTTVAGSDSPAEAPSATKVPTTSDSSTEAPSATKVPTTAEAGETATWPTTPPPTDSRLWPASTPPPTTPPQNMCKVTRATYEVSFEGRWNHFYHGDPKDFTPEEFDEKTEAREALGDSHGHWSPMMVLAHPFGDAGFFRVGKVVSPGVKETFTTERHKVDKLMTEHHVGFDERTDEHASSLFFGAAFASDDHPLNFKEKDDKGDGEKTVSSATSAESHEFTITVAGKKMNRRYTGDGDRVVKIIDHSMYTKNAKQKAEVVLDFETECISAISKAEPSPDWFAGLSDLCMCNNNHWREESIAIEGRLYDAGIDDGATFLTHSIVEDGKEHPVKPIDCKGQAPHGRNEQFCLPDGPDELVPVARWVITLKSVEDIDTVAPNFAGSLSVSIAFVITFLSMVLGH